jgi:hypothetical protein
MLAVRLFSPVPPAPSLGVSVSGVVEFSAGEPMVGPLAWRVVTVMQHVFAGSNRPECQFIAEPAGNNLPARFGREQAVAVFVSGAKPRPASLRFALVDQCPVSLFGRNTPRPIRAGAGTVRPALRLNAVNRAATDSARPDLTGGHSLAFAGVATEPAGSFFDLLRARRKELAAVVTGAFGDSGRGRLGTHLGTSIPGAIPPVGSYPTRGLLRTQFYHFAGGT